MTVRVITGSKQQIAEQVSKLPGEVREAIVFIEDGSPAPLPTGTPPPAGAAGSAEEFFAEMRPHMSSVGESVLVDDSRQAVYERQEGE